MKYRTFKRVRFMVKACTGALVTMALAPMVGLLCVEDAEPLSLWLLIGLAVLGVAVAKWVIVFYDEVSQRMDEEEFCYWQRKIDRQAGERRQSK